jgi:hypothetical protein
MDEQHPVRADRQLMHEAGFAQDHAAAVRKMPATSATASWLLNG